MTTVDTATVDGVDATEALHLLRQMLSIRHFEQRIDVLFRRGKLPGFVHLYLGEEATAVGVCSALRSDDRITSTHRGHGHLIAKGAQVDRMMAELMGRSTGYCHGKGGSMHIVDFELGIMGTNGIVGAGIPIATGSAWGDQFLGHDNVSVAFFGDGASNQGVFFESMNLAAVWKLPIVFVCENNLYGEWSPSERTTAGRIVDRGQPFGIPGVRVDGNDVLAVREAALAAVERARSGGGPSIIEAMTYRWSGHNLGEEAFAGDYRPKEEQAHWRTLEPIAAFTTKLVASGLATQEEIDLIDAEEKERVAEAVRFAEASPFPDPSEALEGLYVETRTEGAVK